MSDRRGSRFVLEVVFLVVLAVALTLAKLDPLEIGGVMLLGWLIVAILEWAAWRGEPHYGSGFPPRYYVPERQPAACPAARTGSGGLPGVAPRRSTHLDRLCGTPSRGAGRLAPYGAGTGTGTGVRGPAEPGPEPGDLDDDRWTAVGLPAAPLEGPEPEPGPDPQPRPAVTTSRGAAPTGVVLARSEQRRRALQPRSARRPTAPAPVRPGRDRVAGRGRRTGASGWAAGAPRPGESPGIARGQGPMRSKLAVREIALAGLAVLAAAVSLAVTAQTRDKRATGPQPEGSFVALAGSSGPAAFGRHTACGGVLRPDTEGVAQPTLPCGVRIFITFDGTTVLTQVVDRGPYAAGRQFDLTDALARRLGLHGVQQIHWSYARAG